MQMLKDNSLVSFVGVYLCAGFGCFLATTLYAVAMYCRYLPRRLELMRARGTYRCVWHVLGFTAAMLTWGFLTGTSPRAGRVAMAGPDGWRVFSVWSGYAACLLVLFWPVCLLRCVRLCGAARTCVVRRPAKTDELL